MSTAVILDINRTLIDFLDLHTSCWENAFAAYDMLAQYDASPLSEDAGSRIADCIMNRSIVWTAAALLCTSCALVAATPPQVEVSTVELRRVGLLDQTLGVTLCVTNPNTSELAFRRIQVVVDAAGSFLADGASEVPVRLPPRSSVLVPFTVVSTVRNLGPQFLSVLRAGAVDYRLHGSVTLNTLGINPAVQPQRPVRAVGDRPGTAGRRRRADDLALHAEPLMLARPIHDGAKAWLCYVCQRSSDEADIQAENVGVRMLRIHSAGGSSRLSMDALTSNRGFQNGASFSEIPALPQFYQASCCTTP